MPEQKTVAQRILSSQLQTWCTPPLYLDAVRAVFGDIELDPASCASANRIVCAARYFTEEQNGLLLPWYAHTVWLNPPYGRIGAKSNQAAWAEKLLTEYAHGHIQQAIALFSANTDTRWFHQLFAFPLCFTRGRIAFFAPGTQETRSGNTSGSVFVYCGPNKQRFAQVFAQFGCTVKAVDSNGN